MNSEHPPNLPRSLVQINVLNQTAVSWETMKGKGLPDPSGNEWNLILSFFERGQGQHMDRTELANFFCDINSDKKKNRAILTQRLGRDLKRRSTGKIQDEAGIFKQQKTMDCVSLKETPMISESGGDAAAAEGSSQRLPDGAAAQPRPRPGPQPV